MDTPTPPDCPTMTAKVVSLPAPTEHKYILKNGIALPISDLYEWGNWFEENRTKHMKQNFYCGVMISTVFLGIDYRFSKTGKPVLWETMLFAKTRKSRKCFNGVHMWRYTSQDAAIQNHQYIVGLFVTGRSVSWIRKQLEQL